MSLSTSSSQKKLLILSTCGTSLLTNGCDKEFRSFLNGISNKETLSDADEKRLNDHADQRLSVLLAADSETRRAMSAELNSLAAIMDRWQPSEVQHILVHTDTAIGRCTADLLKGFLEGEVSKSVVTLTAGGLRTSDLGEFRDAVSDLTKKIYEIIPGYREAGYFTVFNLTGGFKSLNSYLQVIGMLLADRCVYLFESWDSALIEIPRLPITLTSINTFRDHLDVFRQLDANYPVSVGDVTGIPESLWFEVDGKVGLSLWGDVEWARHRATLLAPVKILPPLSPKLELTDQCKRDYAGLAEASQRCAVHETLDALSSHLDGHQKSMLKSHTFKKLQGNPRPPSTHEVYLWSDGAAWRLYGHFKDRKDRGRVFVVDSMGPHL